VPDFARMSPNLAESRNCCFSFSFFYIIKICNLPSSVDLVSYYRYFLSVRLSDVSSNDQASWLHTLYNHPPSSLAHHCLFYYTMMRFQLFQPVILSLLVSLSTAARSPHSSSLRHKRNWSAFTNRTVLNFEDPSELEKRDGTKYVFMHHVSGCSFHRWLLSLNLINGCQIVGSEPLFPSSIPTC